MKTQEHDRSLQRSETALKIDANAARNELSELQQKIQPVDLGAKMAQNQQEMQERAGFFISSFNPCFNGFLFSTHIK